MNSMPPIANPLAAQGDQHQSTTQTPGRRRGLSSRVGEPLRQPPCRPTSGGTPPIDATRHDILIDDLDARRNDADDATRDGHTPPGLAFQRHAESPPAHSATLIGMAVVDRRPWRSTQQHHDAASPSSYFLPSSLALRRTRSTDVSRQVRVEVGHSTPQSAATVGCGPALGTGGAAGAPRALASRRLAPRAPPTEGLRRNVDDRRRPGPDLAELFAHPGADAGRDARVSAIGHADRLPRDDATGVERHGPPPCQADRASRCNASRDVRRGPRYIVHR